MAALLAGNPRTQASVICSSAARFRLIAAALLAGSTVTIVVFGVISMLALREFITLTPTHRGDHRALFWTFFVFTPLQYLLIWRDWYGLFSILIPVYAFLFLPLRIAVAGDTTQFFERTSKIQWGLMVCVYCVSHAPALLILHIPGYNGREAALILFLLIMHWTFTRSEPAFLKPFIDFIAPFFPTAVPAPVSPAKG